MQFNNDWRGGVISEKARFEDAIFNLMIMINQSNGDGCERMICKHVEILECMLKPYLDDKYEEEIKENLDKLMKDLLSKHDVTDDMVEIKKWLFTKSQYGALCSLLFRKEFLPQFKVKPKTVGVT